MIAAVVLLARIAGTIDPATSAYLQSAIARAERTHAAALVVELDTPGGLVSSVRGMTQAISASTVPVIVYTAPSGAAATSAGALLMLSAHVAAMAPGTNVGAAHPVGSGGEDIKGDMRLKVLNDTLAYARSLAEVHQRDAALAQEIVAKSRSFTAEEALAHRLIDRVSPSVEALLASVDGLELPNVGGHPVKLATAHASIEPVPMSWGQELLHRLANPNLATMLMTAGVVLLYLEFSQPGLVLPGVLGGVCLLTAFMGLELLPIRAGALALLALGVLMLLLEPFVVSHGAIAAGGLLAFGLGLLWLVDPASTDLVISPGIWVLAVASLLVFVALIAWAASRTRQLARQARERIGGGALLGLAGYTGEVESIAPGGLSGSARFRGETWEFVSAEPVRVGESVRARKLAGMKVEVEKESGRK